jgi:hypothetical protein
MTSGIMVAIKWIGALENCTLFSNPLIPETSPINNIKNSGHDSQNIHCISITKINRLMLFWEIITA